MKTTLTLALLVMLGLGINAVPSQTQEEADEMGAISEDLLEGQAEDVESQMHSTRLKVLYAYYGLGCSKGNLRSSTQTRSTRYAASRCDGKSSCRVKVHNRHLGDPYGGCPKDFIVVAQCGSRKVVADYVRAKPGEGGYFSLKCPC